jgi:copper chaperone
MKQSINIQNLKCGGCAKTIKTKLLEQEGVLDVEVNLQNEEVSFDYEDASVIERVKSRLKTLGYPAVDEKNSIIDKTRSFVSCASGRLG